MSWAAVAVTIVSPVLKTTSKISVEGVMLSTLLVTVAIFVPDAAVLSYTVIVPVSAGELMVIVCRIPLPVLKTVVVGAAAVMFEYVYPGITPVLRAIYTFL